MQRANPDNNASQDSTSCSYRVTAISSTLTQVSLAVIGLGAGALYVGPSQRCVAAATCGQWLAEAIGNKAATAVFVSGGGNFALINAYLASKSINALLAFERKQPTWTRRIVWGGVISVFTVSQSMSALVSTVSTSTHSWQIFATVGSSIPNSLYSAVGTMDYELPMLYSYLKNIYRALHYGLSDACFDPSEEELRYRQRAQHYRQQQKHLLRVLDQHWQYLQTHPRETAIALSDSPLEWLMTTPARQKETGCVRSTVRLANITANLAATAVISVPFLLNNFNTISPYLHNPIASGFATAYFSYAFLYSNMKLLSSFMQGVVNILDRLITGRPIDSLIYQLHPYVTAISVGIICAFASLSYALMNVIFEMEFPNVNQTREGFRYAADVGIDLYHIAGMFYLFELLYATFTPNKQDQFLYKIQSDVERMHKMNDDEFSHFVESNTDDYNIKLGIQRYQPSVASVVHCEAGEGSVQVPDSPDKRQKRFCLFWGGAKPAASPPDETSRLLPSPQPL